MPITTLCVVSHVVHYVFQGSLYAYGPYAREIDIWADLFPEVLIAAPCRTEAPPGDAIAFTRPNIRILPQPETGGATLRAKAHRIVSVPAMVWSLCRAMRQADAIHVRCPGNLGLLGAVLAPLFSRYRVAKYAGQWISYPGEPWTARVQRAVLRSRWWGAPVTVYGRWPNQPRHVVPFFTSILTADQLARARAATRSRQWGDPLRVLYVGRLSKDKNVDVLLSAVAGLKAQRVPIQCIIVGDGPLRRTLEAQATDLEIGNRVRFVGAVGFERVLDQYEQVDVLVLASESEGWPKAIAEGMAFGLVCVGSDRGLVPEMLCEGRGVLVPPGDTAALAEALWRIAVAPEEYRQMGARAAAWAQQHSLEGLRDALRQMLGAYWGASSIGVSAEHRV